MKYDHNAHSVYLLQYHLIMCVKYRRSVITDDISGRLEEMFRKIGETYGISVDEWNHDGDHIHVLFRAKPKTEISKFINAYKSSSSRRIKEEFPETKKSLWKEMFWSKSFCLLSCGGAPIEVVEEYIASQGEDVPDHRTRQYRSPNYGKSKHCV